MLRKTYDHCGGKMFRYRIFALFVFILTGAPAFSESEAITSTTRGAMLYENHCIQCHTQQVHWREKKIATDWNSLIAQVDRWQNNSGLKLNKSDIEEVSHYLNDKFYHYP